ncbi:Outer membrane receptor proteins, mostly Fe transport [Myroides marinus]|uniref:Outer membrane receptor proteins, mostly Fe transport n=1 Tax=Myroides marinus TaxID=703342 RepID=A0A1H6VW32_9FLAO|nr:TonB-dependent receptor [Myroides marinus]SEJ08871.1 Outer membrane receptor proteins, mostly Fe transport [Myroides marinus]
MKKYILLTFFLFMNLLSNAQSKGYSIKGRVLDDKNVPISYATVVGVSSNASTQTDEQGNFVLWVPTTKETVEISFMGYNAYKTNVTIEDGNSKTLSVKLKEEKQQLGEINITAKSAIEKTRQSAYTVNAVDVKALANTVSDVNQILNRSAGVRVREEGGLGSNFNFALNGFSGNQIKFYLDGIPLEGVGSSFQLNNIPVNMIERIEIYKGVVPISLGGDALGGALNIITKNTKRKYLDATVSYGSFNTVRSSVNMGMTTDSGYKLQLNAYQNYSDNDYKVNVDVHDFNTGVLTPKRVSRFHDRYHNEGIVLKGGMVNKWYADELLFGITLGKNYNQIQTGNRMEEVYGGRFTKGDLILPSLSYTKRDFLVENLNVSVNANYNLGSEQSVDTLNRLYNWDGDYIIKNTLKKEGGEIERRRFKYKNNNGSVIANANYALTEHHSFAVNYNLSLFNRKGEDLLDSTLKNNNLPKKSNKAVLGFSYQYTHDDRWNTILFLKKYFQYNYSERYYNETYFKQDNKQNFTGYGVATAYNILPDLQVKGSFEHSIRMPEAYEMFGDEVNLASNYNLKPESSNNFNLGVQYGFKINEVNHFKIEANYLYRKATDYIKEEVNTGNGSAAQKVNRNIGGVLVKSFDGEIRYTYKDFFSLMANVTYQDILNDIKYENNSTEVSALYRDRVANIPYLYGNGMVSLNFKEVFGTKNSLRLDYNLMYVQKYYLYAPSVGIAKYKRYVPEQFSQDISVHYAINNGKYNVAVEVKNLANKTLYDNFSLQKPSRSITLKLRYNL